MTTLIVVSDDPQVISAAGQLTWCDVIVLDEALKGVANSHWNTVVLLDLAYPNIIDAIRRYIDREHHVLLVAEPGHDAEIANFLENGGDDYLLKPLHPVLLEKRVRRIVDAIDQAEFMAFATHELKNPLSPITGWVDMIKQGMASGLPQDMIVGWLGIIRDNAVRMENIVNDLRDIAKLDAGQQLYVAAQPVDIAPLITDALNIFKRKIESNELRPVLDLPEMLPQVNADAYRLHQLLTNLISNAVRYSRADEPDETLIISVRPAGDVLQVSIRDQGRGMKADDIELAFARDGKSSGTLGMGVRISKAIVHEHGGEIWAENNADKAVTVHFTLPIVKNQAGS